SQRQRSTGRTETATRARFVPNPYTERDMQPTDNVNWQLDTRDYIVCLGTDGKFYRSHIPVTDAKPGGALTFNAIGALPTTLIGQQGSAVNNVAGTPGSRFADRAEVGVGG
ncbi:MAG TPA: hypothetical protein VFZ98_00090, partial [Vicinamibacterales bacterium]